VVNSVVDNGSADGNRVKAYCFRRMSFIRPNEILSGIFPNRLLPHVSYFHGRLRIWYLVKMPESSFKKIETLSVKAI
jgi:hypothetical protein